LARTLETLKRTNLSHYRHRRQFRYASQRLQRLEHRSVLCWRLLDRAVDRQLQTTHSLAQTLHLRYTVLKRYPLPLTTVNFRPTLRDRRD
jgi:hypothetical protein